MAGPAHLFGSSDTDTTKVVLIGDITAIARTSVVAGMDRDIRHLSPASLLLFAFVLAVDMLGGNAEFRRVVR